VTEDELIQAIRATFPVGGTLSPADTISHECKECQDVAATFANQTWLEIPASAIDARYDSLPLLTPAAFREFLPAFMIRGLHRGPEEPLGINEVLEFTVYSLLPDNAIPWWLARVIGLTDAQAAVIIKFLDHVARGSDYFGKPPRDATEYWESRGRRTKG
jgi:hypothetical protein